MWAGSNEVRRKLQRRCAAESVERRGLRDVNQEQLRPRNYWRHSYAIAMMLADHAFLPT